MSAPEHPGARGAGTDSNTGAVYDLREGAAGFGIVDQRLPEAGVGRRILAVGNMYPPQHSGGYELVWQRAMRHARHLGHDVRILVSDYVGAGSFREDDPNVHRTLRAYWDHERYKFPHLNAAQRLELERYNSAELRRHLDEFEPDVVSWWSMGCMPLSLIEQVRRRGIPAVFVVHDDWLVYGPVHDQWIRIWSRNPARKVLGRVVQRVCGIPTHVNLREPGRFVFNSRYTMHRARSVGLLAPDMTVVYPGIEERFFDSLEPRSWGWRLVYVGRLDHQKGVDTAVEAMAHLPEDATLAIWGTGSESYVDEMKRAAARIGAADRVRFEGFAGSDQLRSIYDQADVVVFPVRWNEPFGLVPLEAMALGRPVVSTARGGTSEYVRDGQNALVFAPDSSHELAACVIRLARDEALRERLRVHGQKTAAGFPAHRFAEQTIQEILRAVPSSHA